MCVGGRERFKQKGGVMQIKCGGGFNRGRVEAN